MLDYIRGHFGRGDAVWLRGGKGRTPLHFAPANGFPVASYQFFLKHFAQDYQLLGLENRGAWGGALPTPDSNWQDHADDLIAFLDQQGHEPVIAMGHSIGATVTCLAAARRPELFRALILFDPAAMPGRYLHHIQGLLAPHLTRHLPLVKRTRQRPTRWESSEAFFDYHRHKPVFKPFAEDAFADYVNAALYPGDDGHMHMRYHPLWEAHNFSRTDSPWRALRDIRCPTLLLRGERSYLHPEPAFQHHRRRLPACVDARSLSGRGHMLLQEDGDGVAALCRDWLRENGLH